MLGERTRVDAIARLDAFYAEEMGCEAGLVSQPGAHVIASSRRGRPAWGGYTKPLQAISRLGNLVVSHSPDLRNPVRAELGPNPDLGKGIWAQFDRLRRVSERSVPYAFLLSGYAMFCDTASFRPLEGRAVLLSRQDPRARDLYSRFDGDAFAVLGPRGEVASWAAIKLKSEDVWEIAVVTEAAYRGKGYAQEVVSAATAHILEQGRVALYIYDRANVASGKVCRALGYEEYALEFFCEY